MAKLLLLHGPNLNLLGTREPEVYGADTLTDINTRCQALASARGHDLDAAQYNVEGDLVTAVQQARPQHIDFIIINPAAYTHTSIALRDAFLAVRLPFIEVHLSNVYAREHFRQQSYLSDIAEGTIGGFGPFSYELAVSAAIQHVEQ
jgi:3-dehydroquinate dehydratase II